MDVSKKSVVISFCGRNKLINFLSEQGISDLDKVTEAFKESAKNDPVLQRQLATVDDIIFQMYNKTFAMDIDIDHFDTIENMSKISAKLIHQLETGIIPEFDENLQMLSEIQNTAIKDCCVNENDASIAEDQRNIIPNANKNILDNNQENNSNLAISQAKKNPKKSVIHYPSLLPNYSPPIARAISEGNLLAKLDQFIRESALFLLQNVEFPTNEDYRNFGKTLVEKYPILEDTIGSNKWSSLNKKISACIRNMRYRGKSSDRRNIEQPQKTKRALVTLDVLQRSGKGNALPEEVEKELLKMIENGKVSKDQNHTELLLKNSLPCRRSFIQAAKSCTEILQKYTLFQISEWVLKEFELLTGEYVPKFEARYKDIIAVLAHMYNEQVPLDDECELKLLLKVFEGTSKRKGQAPICIEEVGCEINFKSDAFQAPFLKVYCDKGRIHDAFILGENTVLIKFHNCYASHSAFFCIITLFAAYYAFDCSYPVPYEILMYCLQSSLLTKAILPHNLRVSVTTFLRKYCDAKRKYNMQKETTA